ncbi:hypothetical protein A9Q73_01430 [Bermanella sp. 47_1433_sub80_T6]|nr:hypothetical protein A9Q73_01430 [Bermanella sp. 47_1433_sub80_T6]
MLGPAMFWHTYRLYVAGITQKDSIMTPSIDPNFTSSANGQSHDVFNWQALIQQHQFGKQTRNPVQSCIHFLNCFISHESLYGDSEGAREMIKVLMILQSVDSPASPGQLKLISSSYEYVCAYRDLLLETQAPMDVCVQFDRMVDVLEVLLQIRQQETSGVLCSYGHLNQRLQCNG